MLRSQIVTDVTVAALLALVIGLLGTRETNGVLGLLVTVGLAGALAIRRLAPGLALVVAWAFAVLQMATWQYPGVSDAMIAPLLFTTSAYGSRRVRTAGLVSAFVGAAVAGVYTGGHDYVERAGWSDPSVLDSSLRSAGAVTLLVLALLLLPWLAGLARRSRVSARMSREAQLLAERDAARADRAVAVEQERVRIARDMHDIVAHSLAVVIAQADGARYALAANPDVADQALGTISATSRRALGDVRELLGALRHEEGTAPTPDVGDVDRLVEDMRAVGLDVRATTTGDPSALPTTTRLAVYRIVQESLTNAFKHGLAGAPVHLTLDHGTDTIAIDVVNRRAADGVSGPGTGHGLVGMRERAVMSGGTMTAGPRDGDFVVAVRMPTTAAPRPTSPRPDARPTTAAPTPAAPLAAGPTTEQQNEEHPAR